MTGNDLPAVNAALNGVSAVFIVVGFVAIRRRQVHVHQRCMMSAVIFSALFLASYLYYHFLVRGGHATEFSYGGWIRPLYFFVLISHIVLAIIVVPPVLITAWLGWRNRLTTHVWLARLTLPVWLYVSLTGVLVYWMLYHLYPAM